MERRLDSSKLLMPACATWKVGRDLRHALMRLALLLLQVQHDFNRNFYFDANEALEYGIIDRIIKPPRSQSLGV